MRELQSIRRDLKRSLARDFRSQLESLRANAHSDVIDEAMWSENVAVALQAIEVDWQRKRQIQAALDRIRTGRYGRCDSCDAAVAEARLAAVPWATRCVRCQEAASERREGLRASGLPPTRSTRRRRRLRPCVINQKVHKSIMTQPTCFARKRRENRGRTL